MKIIIILSWSESWVCRNLYTLFGGGETVFYCYHHHHHHHHLTAIGLSPGGSSPTLVQTKIKIHKTIKISTQTEHRKCKYIHITKTHIITKTHTFFIYYLRIPQKNYQVSSGGNVFFKSLWHTYDCQWDWRRNPVEIRITIMLSYKCIRVCLIFLGPSTFKKCEYVLLSYCTLPERKTQEEKWMGRVFICIH